MKETQLYDNKVMYYILLGAMFLATKYAYTKSDAEDLKLILSPTNKLVEWVTNTTSVFSRQNGYFNAALNITIDKSCSGFNFYILLFLVISFAVIQLVKKPKIRAIVLVFTVMISYMITVFVNTSRILIAINTSQHFPDSSTQYPWLHQVQGTIIYLTFLIVFYLLSIKTLHHLNAISHEKLA